MTTTDPVVHLVDEDRAAAETVQRLASMMNFPCRVFTSGQEFLDAFDPSRSGCLVTELKVSDVNGLRILQRLTEDGSLLPVIFVTAHATLPIAVRAMRAGAYHFLEKPCHEQELWDTIQDAVAMDQERHRAAQRRTMVQERLALLTWKEEEVLWMIGEGKTNRVIAEELGLSIRTVEVRRNTLIKKLGVENPDGLIRFALSLGNGHLEPQSWGRCPLRKGMSCCPPRGLAQVAVQSRDDTPSQRTNNHPARAR